MIVATAKPWNREERIRSVGIFGVLVGRVRILAKPALDMGLPGPWPSRTLKKSAQRDRGHTGPSRLCPSWETRKPRLGSMSHAKPGHQSAGEPLLLARCQGARFARFDA